MCKFQTSETPPESYFSDQQTRKITFTELAERLVLVRKKEMLRAKMLLGDAMRKMGELENARLEYAEVVAGWEAIPNPGKALYNSQVMKS